MSKGDIVRGLETFV